jgi:hypothetical protein
MKQLLMLFTILGLAIGVEAQDPANQAVEDLLESLGDNMSDDTDIQDVLDDWEDLRQRPLSINNATREEFLRLHLLSEIQINNLISYREKTGTIYSLYELTAVDGLSPDIVLKIEPFISFSLDGKEYVGRKPVTETFARWGRTFPGDEGKYEGTPDRCYLRLKHSGERLEYGWVAEKDPGEAFFTHSNKQGFDYNSGFVNFGFGKSKNRLFIGDFHARFGQGLVACQGFSLGKSVETTQIFRSEQGFRSSTSTDENQFLRGIAVQIKKQNFAFYPFVSLHKLDAHVDTLEGIPYFGAFQTSGYHRTTSEIAGEKSIWQFTTGSHVCYTLKQWTLGATILFNRFNITMDRDDKPYNEFLPEGKEHLAAGINWKGTWKKMFFFGEAAISRNSGKALLTGVLANPLANLELSLLYRNINKTYFSYFSGAFIESSRVNDEHGLYFGLKFLPASHWTIQAYSDFFKFKWIKYTTAGPSDGTEFLVQILYSPSKKMNFYLKLFQEEKGQKVVASPSNYDTQQRIDRVRFNYTRILNEHFSLDGRFEYSFYSKQTSEKGFLIFQDFNFKPSRKSFSFNGRLSFFSTDGYYSRIYAYENDLLYSFSIPFFYNKGIRSYLNYQQQLGKHFTFWAKFALTKKLIAEEDVDTKTVKSELKLQLRYKF